MKLIILFSILLVSGCASKPDMPGNPPDQAEVSVEETSAKILDESKNLIETGMPEALVKARKLLSDEDLTKTEQGGELDYIAFSLLSLVYPYYGDQYGSGVTLKSSIYPDLVKEIKSGNVPLIKEENANYYTLMISSAVVFYSKDKEIVERAMEIAEQLASFSPGSLYPLLIRARGREIKGDLEGSFKDYSTVLQKAADCYPASIGIASIYFRKGDWQEAADILEILYSKYPSEKTVKNLLVDSYIRMGNTDKANSILEQILSAEPDNVDLALKRARLSLESGQIERAGKLTDVFEESRGVTEDSLYIRVRILMVKGRFREAEGLLKENGSLLVKSIQLSVLYGKILISTGRYDEGLDFLEKEISQNPGNSDLSELLLDIYIHKRRWNDALSVVNELLKKNPGVKIKREGVSIYFNLKMYDKAFALNQDLLSGENPSLEDFIFRAKLLLNRGLKKEASKELSEWIEKSKLPSDRSIFYYYKSLCTDDPEEKKDYLQQALFENLQNLSAITALADLYEKQGEYRKAYRYLKQAAIIVPGDTGIRSRLQSLEKKIR